MTTEELNNLRLIGCVNEDGLTYELNVNDRGDEFYYENEAGYIVRIELDDKLDVLPLKRELMLHLNTTISDKLLDKGLVSSGFIYCRDGIYVINSDETNIRKLSIPSYELNDDVIDLIFTDVETED